MQCPKGAKWHRVADNRPSKGCGDLSLEEGCSMPGGRKHGVWIVYEKRTNCAKPASIHHYKEGRKHGEAQLFGLICAGKGAAERCRSAATESGNFAENRRHGLWRKFTDAGVRAAAGNYYQGTKQGPWTTYSPAGQPLQVQCFADGKPTWIATPTQVATRSMPCAVTREKKKETEFAVVSADDEKASKLVRLAQSTPKLALRVRYLQKAVQLAPSNGHYKQLLAAASAEKADAAGEKQDAAGEKSGAAGEKPPAKQ